MKRYNLGSHHFIDNIFNAYNNKNSTSKLLSSSGLLIDENYEFSSVVEYFELTKNEIFSLEEAEQMVEGSFILAKELNIPLFIIVYNEGNNFFKVISVFKELEQDINFENGQFTTWWKKIKGTPQSKPFYNKNDKEYKIIQILDKYNLKWGGDIDGFIVENNSINCIIEFRKATNFNINIYDPGKFFHGTSNGRSGDYYTWKPLIKLKKQLNIPLILITLSEVSPNFYGITVVKDAPKSAMYYENGLTPNNNIKNNLDELLTSIENIIK